MDERTLLAAAQAANEFQKERRPSDVNAAGGMGGRRRSFQFNDPALIPEEVLDKRAARKSDSWLKWIGKTSLRVGGHRSLLCARMHVLWTPGLPDARVP